MNFLISELKRCIYEGILRHYFFPKFNLLSIKLTPEARMELLQFFEIIIQRGVCIMKECRTLCKVWSLFVTTEGSKNDLLNMMKMINVVRNDQCLMSKLDACTLNLTRSDTSPFTHRIIGQILDILRTNRSV